MTGSQARRVPVQVYCLLGELVVGEGADVGHRGLRVGGLVGESVD